MQLMPEKTWKSVPSCGMGERDEDVCWLCVYLCTHDDCKSTEKQGGKPG